MGFYNIKLGSYIILYLWATYVIYLISPIRPVDMGLNESYTIIFLLIISIAIFLGCYFIRIPQSYKNIEIEPIPIFGQKFLAILQSLLIIVIIGYLFDFFKNGFGGFTLELGENYEKTLTQEYFADVSFWGQIYALASPFRYFILSYGIYNYEKLTKLNKVLYIGLITASCFLSLFGLGTQKGVGDILIIIFFTYWIKALKGNYIKKFKKVVLCGILIFVALFSYSQASRYKVLSGANEMSSSSYSDYNSDNWVCDIFGREIGEGLIRFGNYISNGYPGLNYCLQMSFEWTYGYGGSRAANDYMTRYFGLESQFENTLPVRMENEVGWPGLMIWPSAFAWWASDLTWVGVIILMFVFIRYLCILLKESLEFQNPLSIAIFSYLFIGIVFLPCNNQLMQGSANFISTITLIVFWAFFHKKFNGTPLIECENIE